MRHLPLVALTALALAGCAAPIPRSYVLKSEQPVDASGTIAVVDARPAEDKLMRVEEDPSFLIIKYGDGDFSVDRIELLRLRLQKEFARSPKQISVEISRFASTVSRQSLGMSMGGPVRSHTTWIVAKPDGTIPASYVAGSVMGNVIGQAMVNSEWFRSQPSTRASLSTLIQGSVNGVSFLGNDSDNVNAGDLADAMPRVIEGAVQAAVRDIKRKLAATEGG